MAFLHDNLNFDLPQEAVEREAQRRTNDIAMRAQRQGLAEDEIMKNQEEIVNTATQQAKQSVKVSFILEEIAKKENLQVSDAQLSMAVANWADRSRTPVKKFIAQAQKNGMIDRMRDDLRLQNALEFLKEQAVVEDIEPAEDKHGCAFEEGKAE
jgi:trigger factor